MATLYYRPYTSDPITDGELAPDAAAAGGLRGSVKDYEYIFPAPPSVRQPAPQGLSNSLIPKLHSTGPDYIAQLDGQLGEIEKYKDAMRKMGQDILALRDRVRELELVNSRLRTDLGNYADTAKILHDSVELDGIPKPELLTRYARLKRQLGSTEAQVEKVRRQVHSLQQEVIGEGRQQQQLQRVSSAHQAQQKLLQQLQERAAKVKRLEEACAKNEEAIETLEQRLREQRAGQGQREEAMAKHLMDENRELRGEITRQRDKAGAHASTGMEASERLELYQLLDTAEARVAALEHQLEAEARSHRQEKSQLLEEIAEAERRPPAKPHPRKQHRHLPTRRRNQLPHPHFFAVPVPVDFSHSQPRRYADSQSEDEDDDDNYDNYDDYGDKREAPSRRRGGR